MEQARDPALDIRRVELKGNGERRAGTVRWWKSDKGYCRITADDGEVLFVHFSGVETSGDEYVELQEGQRVSFVTDFGMADHNRSVAGEVLLSRGSGSRGCRVRQRIAR
jgi:CspA family cold shock protein